MANNRTNKRYKGYRFSSKPMFVQSMPITKEYNECEFSSFSAIGVSMDGVIFKDCKFTNCNFYGSSINNAMFENCTLINVGLHFTKANNLQMKDCECVGVNFSNIEADKLWMVNSKLIECNLDNANVNGVMEDVYTWGCKGKVQDRDSLSFQVTPAYFRYKEEKDNYESLMANKMNGKDENVVLNSTVQYNNNASVIAEYLRDHKMETPQTQYEMRKIWKSFLTTAYNMPSKYVIEKRNDGIIKVNKTEQQKDAGVPLYRRIILENIEKYGGRKP